MRTGSQRTNGFDRVVGRACAALVDLGRRRAGLVLVLAVLASVGSLYYAANHLGINSNTKAMLSDELPFRRMVRQMREAFPGVAEPIIVVIDGDSADAAREAAAALADRLTLRPDLFRGVFAPGVGSFFETHGLLYVDTETLEKFSDRVIEALPFISALAREPTVARLFRLIDGAITREDPGRLTPSRLPDLMEAVSTILEAPLENEDESFSWRSWILGEDADAEEGHRRLVLAQPVHDYTDMVSARGPVLAVRQAIDDLGLSRDPGLSLRITGNPALGTDEMSVVAEQAGVLAVFGSLAVVTFFLFYAMRSSRLVAATLAPLLFGLCWTTAFAAFAIGHLNLVSIAFAVLFIGLGVDFGIHFALRYRELLDSGMTSERALYDSGADVGGSLTLCAATTAIGFYAFIPTRYAGVAELGVIAGTGMFISLFANLLIVPALLSCFPVAPRSANETMIEKAGRSLTRLPLEHAGKVTVLGLAIAVLAAATLPAVRFDPDPIKVRDPRAESVRALTDLLVDSSESPWTVELLRPDLEEADRTAIEVEELETVSRAITLSDFVPDEQEDKIEILDDLAFFLEPLQMYSETPPEPTTAAEAAAAIAQLKTSMTTRTTDEQDSESMRSGMRRLGAALDRFLARVQTADDADAEVRRLERNMLGELPQWIEDLQRALLTEPVDVDDLPPNLIARYIAADGRARVEVFAEGDLSEPGRLETFVSSMQDYDSHVGGYAVEIIESGRAIVHSLRQAFTTALFVVAAILLFMWRSARDTALVLASLLLAALMTAAATVVFDLPFNFADVIVLPLLLGIGVDSGIHLVHRHRQGGDASSIMQSSTAKAVLFSALTTIASFGSLGFSSHLGIASLGQLLATGLLLMLVANLIFLPALLAYTDRRRLRKANAAVPSAH